jgi:hypothetical protein
VDATLAMVWKCAAPFLNLSIEYGHGLDGYDQFIHIVEYGNRPPPLTLLTR